MPSKKEILERELADKLRLEDKMKPDIRRIFRRVVDDFRVSVARSGSAPDAGRYIVSLQSILEDQYRRVQKVFKGAVHRQNYGETKQAEDDENEELIAAIFLLWMEQHAPTQADIIAGTTARDMQDAISQARDELVNSGKRVDNRSLAAVAVAILKRILRPRVDLIAVIETQTAAETAKVIEAGASAGVTIPGIPMPSNVVPIRPAGAVALKKSWLDLRDARVRATHLQAGRTYQAAPIPVNEAFIVGGARLMFPGDTSLGAPIREIAHCRCSARYQIVRG